MSQQCGLDPAAQPTSPCAPVPCNCDRAFDRHGATLLLLAANENPLGASPKARAAAAAALAGSHRYPAPTDGDLCEGIARCLGHGLKPEHFVTGNGSSDVLSMIARALPKPGD